MSYEGFTSQSLFPHFTLASRPTEFKKKKKYDIKTPQTNIYLIHCHIMHQVLNVLSFGTAEWELDAWVTLTVEWQNLLKF